VTVAVLRVLGADAIPGADPAVLDDLARQAVRGGGRRVGAVRATLPF
jgi:hypothetical protein